jgi:hypothetical protein
MRTIRVAIAAGLLALVACNFDILNTNQPTLDDLVNNPTKSKLRSAATGLFFAAGNNIEGFIWRIGSLGREGINLSGNNQPDYQEPYAGPVQGGGSFGGNHWGEYYGQIRGENIYLTAVPNAPDLTAGEKSASLGFGKTLKALSFLYVVETHAQLGAPVDVDIALNAPPAPFVSEDSVYGYILGLLNSGLSDLNDADAAGANFPFPVPPGFAGFETPATFAQLNRALAAKAYVFRATAANGCAGAPATCYASALTALGGSFLDASPASFQNGAYFDFSTASGGNTNSLSDPPNGVTFFALQSNLADAQLQTGGANPDQRVLDKITAAIDTQVLGGIPEIPGELKFTIYLTAGAADAGHSIPIIKDEELILLRAEASWFGGNKAGALADVDLIRQNSGGLPATSLTIGSLDSAFVTELLYNRRFSLLWEQGTRWIDARRYGRLSDIPAVVTGGNVPAAMPIPKAECDARGLSVGPWSVDPDVLTCTPPIP